MATSRNNTVIQAASPARLSPEELNSLALQFNILGIEPTTDKEKVTAAYRKLARELHPDKHLNESEKYNKLFQEAKDAYIQIIEKITREHERVSVFITVPILIKQAAPTEAELHHPARPDATQNFYTDYNQRDKFHNCLLLKPLPFREDGSDAFEPPPYEYIAAYLTYFLREREHEHDAYMLEHRVGLSEEEAYDLFTKHKTFIPHLCIEIEVPLSCLSERKISEADLCPTLIAPKPGAFFLILNNTVINATDVKSISPVTFKKALKLLARNGTTMDEDIDTVFRVWPSYLSIMRDPKQLQLMHSAQAELVRLKQHAWFASEKIAHLEAAIESGETVAIQTALQERRYPNIDAATGAVMKFFGGKKEEKAPKSARAAESSQAHGEIVNSSSHPAIEYSETKKLSNK